MEDDDQTPGGTGLRRWVQRFTSRESTITTGAALCALVAIALLWPVRWLFVLVSALVLAFGIAYLIATDARYWSGRFMSARLVLVSGSLAYFAIAEDWLATLGALLAGVAVVAGTIIRNAISRLGSPNSANLAGVRSYPELVVLSRASHAVIAACVLALVMAAAFRSGWLGVVAGVVAIVVAAVFSIAAFQANRIRRRALNDSFAALRKLDPVFYLHWDAPSEGFYQVTMWIPYLKRIGLPFAVIVRTTRQLRTLARELDVPIIYCSSEEDVDRTIVPSLTTVFFVNTALRNAHYLRFNELRSVQLNHGDSDKPASASRQFRAFDRNFVAGQAAVDRFALYGIDMPASLVRVVGRPQVEPIRQSVSDRTPLTVLYAPTWGGFFADSNLSSLPIGQQIVDELLARGCRVIFRPHAFTDRHEEHALIAQRIRERLAEDAAATGRDHVYGPQAESELSIIDCFNESDAMVADVSSIVTDYLYSEKPLAMVSVGGGRAEFVQTYPVARAAYVIDAAAADLDSAFDDMLGTDSLREVRRQLRTYYLGDFPAEGYADVFVRAAREEIAASTMAS